MIIAKPISTVLTVVVMLLVLSTVAAAQERPTRRASRSPSAITGSLLGGVPTGQRTASPISLSLREAVDRALQSNLGVLLQQETLRVAEGTRAETLSDLLPNLTARVTQTRQQVNLAAFGFTGFPGSSIPTMSAHSMCSMRGCRSRSRLSI